MIYSNPSLQNVKQMVFVWFDSLRPINNLSVKKGRVFLGWTSTKLVLMFLLKDTTQWHKTNGNVTYTLTEKYILCQQTYGA